MRHNRRAVMTERYKLYMRKHIFNGRYFVRNLQIFVCVIVITALVIGGVALSHSGSDDVVQANATVSMKDALFGNSEEEKSAAKADTSKEDTEEAVKEKVTTEAAKTEAVMAQEETPVVSETPEPEEQSEFANKCIANVDETLNIRKEPSTEAEFVGSMNPGAIAIVEGTEGDWTKIKSGDVEGYVLSQFVLTGESAEELAENYVTLRGTVLEDGVNIRSEKSTNANILVVLDKDDTITVLENPKDESEDTEKTDSDSEDMKEEQVTSITEEVKKDETDNTTENTTADTSSEATDIRSDAATVTEEKITEVTTEGSVNSKSKEKAAAVKKEAKEEIEWLPVMLEDGQIGYVSADLVDVDELYEIAVSAEELERQAAEEAARKAAEEEAARKAAEEAAANQSSGNNSSNGGTSNSNSDSYKGATTTPVTTSDSGDCIGTFTITAYCGCKKCSGGSGKTASGTTPTEGRTIAADTSVLPFGTQVVIGGIVYTVEDCGSGVNGNHIDIFFATHKKAMAFGKKTMKVYKY